MGRRKIGETSQVVNRDQTFIEEKIEDLKVGNVEDFSELFGDGTKDVKVQLYRRAPKYFNGVDISGFLDYLSPGDDIGTIKERYGGGRYQIMQTIGGLYKMARTLQVAGQPKPGTSPAPDVETTDASETTPHDVEAVPPGAEHKGVPLAGSTESFLTMVERMKAIEAIFPPKPDINETLLNLVLARSGDGGGSDFAGIVDQADKISAIMDRFRTTNSGGTSMIDLGLKVLEGFIKYLEKVQPAAFVPQGEGKAVLPSPGAPAIDTLATPSGKLPDSQPQPELKASGIAEKAASYLIAGFLDDPPQTPDQIASVLRAVLPDMTPDALKGIQDQKEGLYLICRSILANQVDVDSEMKEKFRLLFDETLDLFLVGNLNLKKEGESNASSEVERKSLP